MHLQVWFQWLLGKYPLHRGLVSELWSRLLLFYWGRNRTKRFKCVRRLLQSQMVEWAVRFIQTESQKLFRHVPNEWFIGRTRPKQVIHLRTGQKTARDWLLKCKETVSLKIVISENVLQINISHFILRLCCCTTTPNDSMCVQIIQNYLRNDSDHFANLLDRSRWFSARLSCPNHLDWIATRSRPFC